MNDTNVKAMLRDSDPYVRRDACFAVSESRDKGLIPELVNVLRDENPGVKEAALNALISIGGGVVAAAVCPMLRVEDASLRNIAIEILQQVGPEGLDNIATMLDDPDDDVVKFAVDIIAGIKEAEGVRLLSPLVHHRNPNVRGSVAVCLGRIEAEGSSRILLEILNDTEQWVRFSAIEGLGLLRDQIALRPLLDIIEDEEGLIREAAIEAISSIAGPEEAADVLHRISGIVRQGHVINNAPVVCLLEKAASGATGFRREPGFVSTYYDFLCSSMEDTDQASRLQAVKGLGLLRVPGALEKVFGFINGLKEIDEETEAECVDAVVSLVGHGPLPKPLEAELGKMGACFGIIVAALRILRAEDAVPVLEGLMPRAGKQELRELVSAIEAIGSLKSVDALYNALKSTDGHTREISARALASLSGESAVPGLFEALKKERYRDVAEKITDVLAVIPSQDVKKGFCGLLDGDSEVLREMGARGLGMIGDEAVLEHLEKAVTDDSPGVRKAAYRSMAKLGIPDAIELVIEGLKDSHDDVRLSVLQALGGWTGQRIKEALIDVLKDENIWVRYQGVNLIGELGERDTEGVLQDLLLNDVPPVKAAAATALGKSGSAQSIKVLEQFTEHPDPKVREAVYEAMESLKCLL
ncbi:MAG: HEAT repeat domain-containing protein [Thermodesulfobacteriota bacterium]